MVILNRLFIPYQTPWVYIMSVYNEEISCLRTVLTVHLSSAPKQVKFYFGPVNFFRFYLELYKNKFKNLIWTSNLKFLFRGMWTLNFIISGLRLLYYYTLIYFANVTSVIDHNYHILFLHFNQNYCIISYWIYSLIF